MKFEGETRRFADFYEGALPFQMSTVPGGGMCLSVFLILWRNTKNNILLGKVNKDYDWIRIGALDNEGAQRVGSRWMLPSSHLLIYESPDDGAKRVLSEQLGIEDTGIELNNPRVFSEVYDSPKFEIKNHWDVEFVFTGEMKENLPTKHEPWSVLEFVDLSSLKDSNFARNHQDILAEAGFR
ncbi:MAG TPA: NUDIX domain-containing protein [Nitrososphaerales archaeon]|nr:NUDIX domain-containing protein [Nitrososphaerales archaeon]